MNYRTYADLIKASADLCSRIEPPSAVIGVPRSGMLLASMMASNWNVSLQMVGFTGSSVTTGRRVLSGRGGLIVEDSVSSGNTIKNALEIVRRSAGWSDLKTVCAYVAPGSEGQVDFYHEVIPHPRVWEWNVFHSVAISLAGCDIDGVVCPDPKTDELVDPDGYAKEILELPRIRRITYGVGAFVTSRLESRRSTTEAWLKQNDFKYGALIMSTHGSARMRRALGDYAEQKARAVKRLGLTWFVESSRAQANAIGSAAGVPVLCTDSNTMIGA